MQRSWRMTVYDVAVAGSVTVDGGAHRFFYLHDGRVSAPSRGPAALESDAGFFASETTSLEGEGMLWVYEAAPFESALLGGGASVVLSRCFEREFGPPLLLRADRIESPPGSVTPRHTHRGPGIRRLLYGRLLAYMGDDVERIEPGQPWFETGNDPIVGTNISGGNSAFVRVMALPVDLKGGKTSFVATSAEEAGKPRRITSRLFGETVIS